MADSKKIMEHPFPKSVSMVDRYTRLMDLVVPEDSLAILINADPDSIASAMALKRFFWRKVKKANIFRINAVKRLDNLAMIRILKINVKYIRKMNSSEFTKWAIVDSQPGHNEHFGKHLFDIIIDHHPIDPKSRAQFMDIKEDYGSNSTLMTEYLRTANIKPSPRLATALFYGIKTDTDNFVRPSTPNDVNAFRYLYQFANVNIIKKIESSEMSKKTLNSFRTAMENMTFLKETTYIHMGKVNDPDVLVMIADFFLKMAEATWSVVSGIYGHKVIIIFRNAGFRLDAGKVARKLFGQIGSAGGHKSAARAEMNLGELEGMIEEGEGIRDFIADRILKM